MHLMTSTCDVMLMWCQDVFEIRYARMPEDRPQPVPMDTGGSVVGAGLSGTYDHSSAASDSGSEVAPATESLRERRLRELQLQVCLSVSPSLCLYSPGVSNMTALNMISVANNNCCHGTALYCAESHPWTLLCVYTI